MLYYSCYAYQVAVTTAKDVTYFLPLPVALCSFGKLSLSMNGTSSAEFEESKETPVLRICKALAAAGSLGS